MNKVLVIGGTYFAGRVFSILCRNRGDMELTFINRGRYSMAQTVPGCREYKCDRHDAASLAAIPACEYDAVVDFCGYEPGDIKGIFDCEAIKFRKYVFLSTADVYARTTEGAKNEACPVVESMDGGAVNDYIYKKMLLEKELKACCAESGISYSIIRPAFVYGPYNYARRESYYIERIVKRMTVPDVIDSDSSFQMVYVKDLGNAIIECIVNPVSDNKAYNLSAPEVMNYAKYMELLRTVADMSFETVPVTVEQVLRENIAVPFPLKKAEDELYDGSLAVRELGITYTPVETAMKMTWNAFKPVYEGR